ncbi:endo-1,3-beta glucanase [Spathaspora passalidarum NRRL Y-27907]|uniref:Glucan endo-1,3-beta-D-glucosidase 1 n=1 Tax=Spathaspora passalidarum (strain NRRL Y-27907 / 11-Y1) TaxID=619300 RepID=G3AUS7_SPAPN|nr:endo-1,3-beta glucanase [Spathaspora passalidarum NRRL Y-27907]EGW30633.1 endo-1,3-beta glucanase [Spathaspora passalidarum NRRL Y-27907]
MGVKDLKHMFDRLDLHHKKPEKYSRPKFPTPKDNNDNIFAKPIATGQPPEIFRRVQHNQLPVGCCCQESDCPIQTNNFYNNLTLGDQTCPIWTLPYSLWYTTDPGQVPGLAFNHTEASQRVFGPDPDAKTAQYYFNPPKIKSFVLSGENFTDIKLSLENHNKFSVTALLSNSSGGRVIIPLVQGMGYITSIYQNVKPLISSQVGFQEFSKCNNVGDLKKYKVMLFNQVTWSIYVQGDVELSLKDPNTIVGDRPGNNTLIQIARGLSQDYDDSAGCYQERADISANVSGSKGTYKLSYTTKGNSKCGSGLVWCLPHHQEVLIEKTKESITELVLDSPTKGEMKSYKTNELVMEEQLPVDITWEPWSSFSTNNGYSDHAKDLIRRAAQEEANQDIVGMANIDSMYTSGKILDKFAYIAYVCHYILQDSDLTEKVLPRVKQAIEIFAKNTQQFPLVYDRSWKGLISSAEPGADFGNSNYNDHHFHYGYHIHAIALAAHIDPDWLHSNDDLVFNYANTLLRDTASPFADEFFPESRSFDWFHGHSFAHGIFASGDGKDEESSSEDYHFAYGMKLYGIIVGDKSMEHRANLMLAIMKRAMNMYMLYTNDNKIQPAKLIGNKVSGILFENKIDFATYFGRGTIGDEWIHGIHMLPITPISSFIRSPKFVKEEWEQKLSGIVEQIPDGWKGILMLNKALFDPKSAWDWFSSDNWNPALIDNGMSRTWSLAYIAGVGGY